LLSGVTTPARAGAEGPERWESVNVSSWADDEEKMMEVFKAVYGGDLWWAEVWEWGVGCYRVVHGEGGEWVWFGP
jgi:hypothetical protein